MKYDWTHAGEEWSAPWGSSAAQWDGTIFPRIHDCLPSKTILEIAPGFGRRIIVKNCGPLIAQANALTRVAGVSRLSRTCTVA